MISVRQATREDEAIAIEWGKARGYEYQDGTFSPLGCVAEKDGEAVCAVWACLVVGVGVAYVENVCSRPGLAPSVTREAFRAALECLEAACAALDYTVLVAYARPGFMRELSRMGWSEGTDCRPKVQMLKILQNQKDVEMSVIT
jgi:hypothetical protein